MSDQEPSVGRAVHYVGHDGDVCRAAIITEVVTGTIVSLCVMSATSIYWPRDVKQDEHHLSGTWHWPERV